MTRLSRRYFTAGILGLGAATALPRAVGASRMTSLTARPGETQLAPPQYPPTATWGYGGGVPGPTLWVQQGAHVQVRFQNELPEASSIHWHGIRIENAMDGVPGLTQKAVPPGGRFDYDFAVPDAGTYWYHSHNRSWEQMARGLYGGLVIREPEGAPEVDHDELLLIDDWRLTEAAQIADGFGSLHDWSHAGRLGNWITVNGDGNWAKPVRPNSRLRLRLANTSNARIFDFGVQGLEGWVIALDGMPLSTPQPLGRVILAPAQRADLLVDVVAEAGEEAFLISHERDGGYAIAAFAVSGAGAGSRRGAPEALPPNPVAEPAGFATSRRAELIMEGGAMGQMTGAVLGGERLGVRDLAAAGKVWAFNGMAEMGVAPLIEADRGETIRIRIKNDTGWPHAIHLHGHHFRQLAEDGGMGPYRDTLLIDRLDAAEIAFVADNPGDWLLHCHMLEHAGGGMMTWLRVT